MVSTWIVALLTLLMCGNVLLLGALAFASKGQLNKETKIAYVFMAITLVLDMVFAIGGAVIW